MYRPPPWVPEPGCRHDHHRPIPPAPSCPRPEELCHCPHAQPYAPAGHPVQVNNHIHAYPPATHDSGHDRPAAPSGHAQTTYHHGTHYHGAYPPVTHRHALNHPRASVAPRRNLTTIILPARRFLVSTPLLSHLLPRTTATPTPLSPLSLLGPLIPTRFPPELFPEPLRPLTDALTLLFERLERISREESTEHAFFDGLEFRLDNARDQLRVIEETFRVAFALCVALDLDAGMGCAPELAGHLGRFLLGLLPRLYVLGNASSRAVCAVMLGYAKVFRSTGECMSLLRGLWDGLDGGERAFVVSALRSAIVGPGPGSNARRMWGALGELGLL